MSINCSIQITRFTPGHPHIETRTDKNLIDTTTHVVNIVTQTTPFEINNTLKHVIVQNRYEMCQMMRQRKRITLGTDGNAKNQKSKIEFEMKKKTIEQMKAHTCIAERGNQPFVVSIQINDCAARQA
jgi:histidinol phosphatase-like PHP family hydrolase